MRERFQNNPQFKLHSNISRAVRNGLSGKGRRRWEDLVGYTAVQLKEHLERQFTRGMGWHNYGRGSGKWHIDHIVPQSAFTFSSPDDPEFRACWALTNLRPLWGDKNISTGINDVRKRQGFAAPRSSHRRAEPVVRENGHNCAPHSTRPGHDMASRLIDKYRINPSSSAETGT